jgi:hypothetical protein
MSWSVRLQGTKQGVARDAIEAFDKCATSYAGTLEGETIAAAKGFALRAIESLKCDPDGGYMPKGYGVLLEASGSASPDSNLSFSLRVERTALPSI